MVLFNKEKDLIFKITNLILIIWLMASLTFLWVKLLNIFFPVNVPTYREYKQASCTGYNWPLDKDDNTDVKPIYTDEECKIYYNNEVDYNNNMKYENNKQLFIVLGNIVIIGIAIYMLNRKREK